MSTIFDLQERIARITADPPADPKIHTKARIVWRRMSDVEPRRVESLWPGYIVKHKLNLLAGYGGVGKDQLMADIIARLSTGRPFPSTLVGTEPTRTLILAAEDDAHEDWRPRLDANDADVGNVLILDGIAEGDGPLRWVDVKHHMPLIEQFVQEEHVGLVYISPLSSYMPGVTRNDAGEVRDTLGYVQRLIDNTGVTVIATLHIGKATDRHGALRILGSVEFVNAARNVLAVNDLPDEYQTEEVLEDATRGRRKVLEVVKANSIIPGPPLSFSRPLDAAVQWHGEAPIGFDESFRAPEPKTTKVQEAEEWLFDFLKGGMQPLSKVERAAKDHGISARTLRRAREALRVQSYRLDFQGPFYWSLPTGAPPNGQEDSGQGTADVGEQRTTLNLGQSDDLGDMAKIVALPSRGRVQEMVGQDSGADAQFPTLAKSQAQEFGHGCVTDAQPPTLAKSQRQEFGQGWTAKPEPVSLDGQRCVVCGEPCAEPGEPHCPSHKDSSEGVEEWSMTL